MASVRSRSIISRSKTQALCSERNSRPNSSWAGIREILLERRDIVELDDGEVLDAAGGNLLVRGPVITRCPTRTADSRDLRGRALQRQCELPAVIVAELRVRGDDDKVSDHRENPAHPRAK